MRLTYPILFLLLLLTIQTAGAQQARPIQYNAGFQAVGSSDKNLPFWLIANRGGIIRDDQTGGFFRAAARTPLRDHRMFDYEIGFDLAAYPAGPGEIFINELYARVKIGALQAYGGRITETHGIHEPTLSTGSMGWSTNALPMPKIGLGITEWTALPLTRDFIHIQGHIAHGWFEEHRFTASPYLHEKTIYGKIGGESIFQFYGGIMHYAVWGGDSMRHGPLPSSLNDFFSVLLATGGGEDALPGEQDYMLGDHLGAWDFGFYLNPGPYRIKAYRHFPLETKDNLKLKSPQDGLFGLHLTLPGNGPVTGILYENLYTMWQDGPRVWDHGNWRDGQKGRENYYNHGIYRSGWTYLGRTIGNPLLTATDMFEEGSRGIENNRVIAHHIGILGNLSPAATWRALFTHTQNHGKWGPIDQPYWDEDYKYYGGLNQFSFLAEITTRLPWHENLTLNAALAGDVGEMYSDRIGMMIGLRWGN